VVVIGVRTEFFAERAMADSTGIILFIEFLAVNLFSEANTLEVRTLLYST